MLVLDFAVNFRLKLLNGNGISWNVLTRMHTVEERKNKNKNYTFCALGVWMVNSLLTPNCLTSSTAFSGDLIEIIN